MWNCSIIVVILIATLFLKGEAQTCSELDVKLQTKWIDITYQKDFIVIFTGQTMKIIENGMSMFKYSCIKEEDGFRLYRSDSATRGKSPSAMGYICIKIGDISFSGVLQVHTSSRMEIPLNDGGDIVSEKNVETHFCDSCTMPKETRNLIIDDNTYPPKQMSCNEPNTCPLPYATYVKCPISVEKRFNDLCKRLLTIIDGKSREQLDCREVDAEKENERRPGGEREGTFKESLFEEIRDKCSG